MKSNMKRIISALILAAAVLSVNSCRIIDWAPINLRVQVQDSEGNDLLDPENDNTWLLGTTISFRGITVDLEETNITEPESKEYGPIIYSGFRLEKGVDCWELVFGEFDGGDEYDDTFMINWPDRTFSYIEYTRKLNTLTVDAKEKWILNNKVCSNPVVIVKERPKAE